MAGKAELDIHTPGLHATCELPAARGHGVSWDSLKVLRGQTVSKQSSISETPFK